MFKLAGEIKMSTSKQVSNPIRQDREYGQKTRFPKVGFSSRLKSSLCGVLLLVPMAAQGQPNIGSSANGRAYALDHCASCHNVEAHQTFTTGNIQGPSFDHIANAPGTTAASLRDSLSVRHQRPANLLPRLMPIPHLSATALADMVSYILSLRSQNGG
jgi:mono/diheme cytochrome c family protein